jgi:streptogramin lyase
MMPRARCPPKVITCGIFIVSMVALSQLLLPLANVGPAVSFAQSAEDGAGPMPALPHYRVLQYPLPKGSLQPWGMSVDSSGRIWFVEEGSNQIGSFDPGNATFREYNVTTPNSLLEEVSVDGAGTVWFTELNSQQLGELDPSSGAIREFKIPRGPNELPCGPIGVTAQSPESIWLTCEFSNQIDRFTPTSGSFDSYDLPVFYSSPLQIVFDREGNFWFTAADSDMIGYATVPLMRPGTPDGIREFAPRDPTYLNTITNAALPTQFQAGSNQSEASQVIVSSLKTPSQLALSPDGKTLWITEHVDSSFDAYDIQNGTLTKYWTSQTHNQNYETSLPNGIAVDPRGFVWIAEHYGNRIAEFDPDSLEMVEYPIPCCPGGQIAGSLYLALGKNSTVWFTEFYGNALGELVPSDRPYGLSVTPSTPVVNSSSDGGNSSARLFIRSYSSNVTLPLSFDVSGISSTGVLENSEAVFSPGSIELAPLSVGSTSLRISTLGLGPGVYYLTVSAKVNSTGIIYSTMLKLIVVPSGLSYARSLLLAAAIVGVAASAIVVGSLALVYRNRARGRRRRGVASRKRTRPRK